MVSGSAGTTVPLWGYLEESSAIALLMLAYMVLWHYIYTELNETTEREAKYEDSIHSVRW